MARAHSFIWVRVLQARPNTKSVNDLSTAPAVAIPVSAATDAQRDLPSVGVGIRRCRIRTICACFGWRTEGEDRGDLDDTLGAAPGRRELELSEEPRKLLFDFYAWSANDLDGRLAEKPEDTVRLNRVLRRWFARVVLRTGPGSESRPHRR